MDSVSSSNSNGYNIHLNGENNYQELLSLAGGSRGSGSQPPAQANSDVVSSAFDVKSAVSQISGQPFAGMNCDACV